jgi:hypothetical protein
MSFSMDKAWGLFLMLQIAGNLNSFDDKCRESEEENNKLCPKSILKIPANC